MAAILIPVPAGFRFIPTVLSHGWYQLPPFSYDHESQVLARVHQFRDGGVARLRIGQGEKESSVEVAVEGRGRLTRERREEVVRVVGTCLNLTRDLSPFYRSTRRRPEYRWVETMGAGRMLVSPTVWEDMAKTLLTTNTSWGATIQMCRRLATLGEPLGEGEHSFPTPERVASLSVDALNDHVRAGYRSAYLSQLARAIAEEGLDLESWREPGTPSDDLFRRIRGLKGFGEYAAGSMCRLLGTFDRLGLDSSCRASFRERNGGELASDKQIALYYEPFGEWCGLALWMDVMKPHLAEYAGAIARRQGENSIHR
ncbi:DNA-3-methyladenine glycosylase family protein [Singulisphaera acidiphila]|uniref:3-methyladenine DNA glycosylase/8-oxoguanine DNA glycosylase n=1 Tax=Singulisphaera acidiphila (strain ATCC BAA-1392 / DSM 18658 / VKM B-2454 / MOB10) TaxID=886293 RepID=L0DH38_SINAD|nr:3-methyladenine DNA glycosylase [Singulisphaera acidiphila]AGA28689.1 3-methyladenine DNA glycosylase/8-oxoguanine DNA glycosylase [Singulisphaera acidiphila DSM 18658]